MKAKDVTDTLDLALAASGCESANVVVKPRLLSDNGSSYIAGIWLIILKTRAWIMYAARRSIHRRKVKLNVGIKQ